MTASGSRPLAGGLPELVADTSNLITVADFLSYGERHGIDYRFAGGINPACFHVGLMAAQGRAAVGHQADARPHHTSRSTHLRQCGADDNQIDQDELFDCHVNSVPCHPRCSQAVLKGRVFEETLTPGWQLTFSDVEVLHAYDSCSTMASPLFVCVVLEGAIQIEIGGHQQRMEAGNALSARLAEEAALRVHQPAEQRLRTLNLALDDDAIHALAQRHGLIEPLRADRPQLHVWPLPGFLAPAIEQALKPQPSHAQRQMMLEALALQMLALGLPQTHSKQGRFSPDERRRLEQVRRHLRDNPAQPYHLKQLAEMASMSPSSLRTKFQRHFGTSVFDYLRECRLQLAHELLRDGHSVQLAAYESGYGHTSNFSTAFRRRFGVCPSTILPHAADQPSGLCRNHA